MAKEKYYVVWKGVTPGVYKSWHDCQMQIKGFEGAIFKSFGNESSARYAYNDHYTNCIGKNAKTLQIAVQNNIITTPPLLDSISVDAACEGNPGKLEYQGVYTATKKLLFKQGPFPNGTVNIGEFLAIVHGLAYLKQQGSTLPLYTDSMTAMSWVRRKKTNTKLPRTASNEKLFELLDRAELWLINNTYETRIIKWDTEQWGEIPADFGRK